MKVCAVFVVVLGLMACTEAGKKMKKCKKDLAAAGDVCDAKLAAAAAECQKEQQARDELVSTLQKKLAESTAIFDTKNCGHSNKVTYDAGKYLLNTEGGVWNTDGWCTVLDDQEGDDDDAYTVSVDLYADTEEENHLGIAYNVQDINNFDIIYYRPHSTDRCFQSGHVVNGKSTWGVKGECPTQPEFKQWFNAKVVVKADSNNADFYLDGEFVVNTQPMRFAKTAKAGVIMANGFSNKGHFKNLEIN